MNYRIIVKKLRNKLVLSQQEFAILLGVSFTSVNRWENGRSDPTIKIKRKILKLCKENGVGVE